MAAIDLFLPASGHAGQTITIAGNGFTGATAVRFGGSDATSFIVASDNIIIAVVAAGASGSVEVVALAGTVSKAGFIFNPSIKLKMPQSPVYADGDAPAVEDLVWVWDESTSVLRQAPISSLPFSSGGGGGGVSGPISAFPIHVRFGDAAMTVVGADTVITDARLIGKTDYIVTTTQGALGEFNDAQLELDGELGTATILGFTLDDGEKISIIASAITEDAGTIAYEALIARITLLEQIAAVFTPSALGARGGMVLWNKPVGEIPAGWQEVTDWRGRLPIGYDPGDADFNAIRTKVGGAKTHMLTIDEMPAHTHDLTFDSPAEGLDYGSGSSRASVTSHDLDTATTTSVGGGTAHSIMNPYRTCMFIEFIGIE